MMLDDNEEFVLGQNVTARGKPRSRSDTVVVSVRLPLQEFSRLESIRSATGKTLSQVVREAIDEWLLASRRSEPRMTVFFRGITTSTGKRDVEGQAVVIEAEHGDLATTHVEIGR